MHNHHANLFARCITMRLLRTLPLVLAGLLLASCADDPALPGNNGAFTDAKVPQTFDYATVQDVRLNLKATDAEGNALAGVRMTVLSDAPWRGGVPTATGVTNASGQWSVGLPAATGLEGLYVETNYPTLPELVKVPLVGGQAVGTVFPGAPTNLEREYTTADGGMAKTASVTYTYMGGYTNQGEPYYLGPNDYVNPALLTLLANTFVNGRDLTAVNPAIVSGTPQTLSLTDSAEIWVTFLHDGAGYRNSLGYYTYPAGSPPTTVADIAQHTVIFPNASAIGSGGPLVPGNKVYLGKFPANTEVGFFVVADGWHPGLGGVNPSRTVYYSNNHLNPEGLPALQDHQALLLWNAATYPAAGTQSRVILTFEDKPRDSISDHDYNDLMFAVEVKNYSALDTTTLPPLAPTCTTDTDADGVLDCLDDYPTDPNKAFNNYYPGKNLYGTLAYEDLWPGKGDYDLNDFVIIYNHLEVTNAAGQVVDWQGRYSVQAHGAAFDNAFAIELPFSVSNASGATGTASGGSVFTLASGLEAGQPNVVLPVFDDGFGSFNCGGCSKPVNVFADRATYPGDTQLITLQLNAPVDKATFGNSPYNPFVLVKRDTMTSVDRGLEIHLPHHQPTALANLAYFGTMNDDSDLPNGRSYVTDENHPWAIHVPHVWPTPQEPYAIGEVYPHFVAWAESGGTKHKFWYLDPYKPKTMWDRMTIPANTRLLFNN